MKKVFKVLGVLVVSIAVIAGGFFTWATFKTQEVTSAATPFIEKNLPLITTWDIDQFDHLFTEVGLESLKSEQGQKIIRYLAKIGEMKSFETPVFIKSSSKLSTKTGKQEVAIFTVEAVFENGPGIITLSLVHQNSQYLFHGVHLNSNYYLDL